MSEAKSIAVVGSVNLDIVATAEKLPVAGETVTGAELKHYPGGKGANQALAARRLGADVSLIACVGDDAYAEEALALLSAEGVDLSACSRHESALTGVGLIAVSASGENQIIVAPGANWQLRAEMFDVPKADAMICQLEIPMETLLHVAQNFEGFFCINLAPSRAVPDALIERADLVVVNETEADFYGAALNCCGGLLARTFGAKGAALSKNGKLVASAVPPSIQPVDTTGAGDAFTAALTLAIIEGQELPAALAFACAVGAATATSAGAQPSLPDRTEVEALLGRT